MNAGLKKMSPIIETLDLTRRFGELTAVDHLNLTVAPGEIFGLDRKSVVRERV